MVKIIAERVIVELDADAHASADSIETADEPLRWLMHGGPGTGKSHVINVVKDGLFQKALGWEMGVQFQVVALQAVMADLLGGDTIHHACGIPAFRKHDCNDEDVQKNTWRWQNASCNGGG